MGSRSGPWPECPPVPRARKKPGADPPSSASRVSKPGPTPRKSEPASDDNAGSEILGGIGVAELRRLIRLVQRTGIGELEVSAGGRAVRISAVPGAVPVAGVPAAAPVAQAASPGPAGGSAGASAGSERQLAITSPMVGTFYRAPAPDADPYVEVGSTVQIG